MKRWIPLIVASLVALGIGFGIGAAVYAGDDDEANGVDAAETSDPTPTPDAAVEAEDRATCLDALAELEQDVEAEDRTTDLMARYEDVLRRSIDALTELDTRRLEELLAEVEGLNEQSQELFDDAGSADVESAVDTCRAALAG